MSSANIEFPPLHKWTHDGDRVLLVKCVDRGGKSRGGFQWPRSGEVRAEAFSPTADCKSGGLFGWPWGLWLGVGKDPDYSGDWIVFACDPKGIIGEIEGEPKAKAPSGEVVYYGDWGGALEYTRAGREAWLAGMFAAARDRAVKAREASVVKTGRYGVSSATGDYGASSATGNYGASSATGHCGVSSATGYCGASSATGNYGASSATGNYGASSATGHCGVSSATGNRGVSSATGYYGASSATGNRGVSSATGYYGVSSATGNYGASSATGNYGASSATGHRGASSATGYCGVSSATGYRGASSATGYRGASSATGNYGASSATGNYGVAALTGDHGTIEVGPQAAGVVTADEFTWLVHLGAVLLHRWRGGHALLTTDGLSEGERVQVAKGVVTRKQEG